nr:MAG TPA: hypothetical protein [Caudoviricetes sp.]
MEELPLPLFSLLDSIQVSNRLLCYHFNIMVGKVHLLLIIGPLLSQNAEINRTTTNCQSLTLFIVLYI